MSNSKVSISIGLPWVSVAIGGLSGWMLTNTVNGLLVGCLCGIIISLLSYIGFIPILGVFLYHIIASALFSWLGLQLTFLYWYGFAWSIVFTCFGTLIIIIFLSDL